jgi:adenylate cyclase
MTACIIKYNGTLDKFLGDGIMAFWNAPLDQANHPELAVRCALDMSVRFEDLRRKWTEEAKEVFDYGISLNAGEVIIGNIGVSGRKMEYTTIGDAVNITSRLLEQTRIFNRKIIITKIYFDRVKDIIDAEELGTIKLKGKEEPVTLLAVVGLKKS